MAEKVVTHVQLEIQQIDHLLEVYGHLLEKARAEAPDLVEITALASVLHSFYTGVEKIFIYIADGIDEEIPSGNQWHRDLLEQMAVPGAARDVVVSAELIGQLKEYLGFRHFYRHGYSFVLEWEKLEGLVKPLSDVWNRVKQELRRFLEDIAGDQLEPIAPEAHHHNAGEPTGGDDHEPAGIEVDLDPEERGTERGAGH